MRIQMIFRLTCCLDSITLAQVCTCFWTHISLPQITSYSTVISSRGVVRTQVTQFPPGVNSDLKVNKHPCSAFSSILEGWEKVLKYTCGCRVSWQSPKLPCVCCLYLFQSNSSLNLTPAPRYLQLILWEQVPTQGPTPFSHSHSLSHIVI